MYSDARKKYFAERYAEKRKDPDYLKLMAERARLQRLKNPEYVKKMNAKRRADNPEKERQRCREWFANNPEKRVTYEQNRRARIRDVGGKLSHGLVERLFILQRGKCACGCGQPLGDDFHRDHILPLTLGGTNTDDNIQLLRQRCNNQKYNKHPVDFMQTRGFLL